MTRRYSKCFDLAICRLSAHPRFNVPRRNFFPGIVLLSFQDVILFVPSMLCRGSSASSVRLLWHARRTGNRQYGGWAREFALLKSRPISNSCGPFLPFRKWDKMKRGMMKPSSKQCQRNANFKFKILAYRALFSCQV